MKRALILVMDGLGCGALADAESYGDSGANTISHITEKKGEIDLPHLESIGFGKIDSVNGIRKVESYRGAFGKMSEKSPGKDSVTGHWELSGIRLNQAFPVFDFFPDEILKPFIEQTGRGVIGNKVASGTAIIKELGEEHMKTGKWIVYTSADSVFQIAAHEDIVPLEELYRACEIAREILRGKNEVGRVIARPFIGDRADNFTRTKYRKDYSVLPPEDSIFDILQKRGVETVGIGKIDDLFAGKGIQHKIKAKGNRACMKASLEALDDYKSALIMTNLVDFDMLYGHQRDVDGYYHELLRFDVELGEIISKMSDEDLLILSSDHGNDPTHSGTDHTREYVPLLLFHKKMHGAINLGTRSTFADLAESLLEFFDIENESFHAKSFYKEIYEQN